MRSTNATDGARLAGVRLPAPNRLPVHDSLEDGIANHFTTMVPAYSDRYLVLPFGLSIRPIARSAAQRSGANPF
ncbi:MAG: hypothetical protein JWQ07_4508 [Ramlibacter sp.]|nr:hypothetical protein [Ramlibacter sp.]